MRHRPLTARARAIIQHRRDAAAGALAATLSAPREHQHGTGTPARRALLEPPSRQHDEVASSQRLQLCALSFPACMPSYSLCWRDERALRASRIALLASIPLLARRAFSLACNGGSSARKPFSLKGKARWTRAQASYLRAQSPDVGEQGEVPPPPRGCV